MGLGLKSSFITSRNWGFLTDTGKYFDRTSDASFDDMTAYTYIAFHNAFQGNTNHFFDTLGIFYDTTNDAGFANYIYAGTVYPGKVVWTNADGSGAGTTTQSTGGFTYASEFGCSAAKSQGSPFFATVFRFDADETLEQIAVTISSGGISYTNNNNDVANTGAVGANGKVSISNTTLNSAAGVCINKVCFWKSALSDADIIKLCGRAETTLADSTTYDGNFRDATRFESFSDLSVTEPEHMWDFSSATPKGTVATIADTGSEANKPLSATGSPVIGKLLVGY